MLKAKTKNFLDFFLHAQDRNKNYDWYFEVFFTVILGASTLSLVQVCFVFIKLAEKSQNSLIILTKSDFVSLHKITFDFELLCEVSTFRQRLHITERRLFWQIASPWNKIIGHKSSSSFLSGVQLIVPVINSYFDIICFVSQFVFNNFVYFYPTKTGQPIFLFLLSLFYFHTTWLRANWVWQLIFPVLCSFLLGFFCDEDVKNHTKKYFSEIKRIKLFEAKEKCFLNSQKETIFHS